MPRARSPRQRPKSSRQRLCRGPETPSAKPTAPSRNVNVDVVFAESRDCRLSAKTFYFFLKKMSLPRACQAGSRQRRTLPRAIQAGSRQRLFCFFFKKSLCREPTRLALGKGGFAESRPGRLLAKTFYFF